MRPLSSSVRAFSSSAAASTNYPAEYAVEAAETRALASGDFCLVSAASAGEVSARMQVRARTMRGRPTIRCLEEVGAKARLGTHHPEARQKARSPPLADREHAQREAEVEA